VLDELERTLPYDLIIIDEAHHYNETGLPSVTIMMRHSYPIV